MTRAPTDVNDLLRSLDVLLRQVVGERVGVHMSLVSGPTFAVGTAPDLTLVLLELIMLACETLETPGAVSIATRRVSIDSDSAPETAMPSGDYVEVAVRASPSWSTVIGDNPMSSRWLSTILQRVGGYVEDGAGFGAVRLFLAAPGEDTILVVEDDDSVREMIGALLRSEGFQVLEACDGDDALNVVAAHAAPIDLVVADVVMPRMNGRELCHRLRSWYPKIRFLFVSGYLGNAPREAGEARTAFLLKPFTADGLNNVVRSLLDRRAS